MILADSADLWRSPTSNNGGSVGTSYKHTRTYEYHAPGISSSLDVHTAASSTTASIHSRCRRGCCCTAVHRGCLGVSGYVAIEFNIVFFAYLFFLCLLCTAVGMYVPVLFVSIKRPINRYFCAPVFCGWVSSRNPLRISSLMRVTDGSVSAYVQQYYAFRFVHTGAATVPPVVQHATIFSTINDAVSLWIFKTIVPRC